MKKSMTMIENKLSQSILPAIFSEKAFNKVADFHRSLASYSPTPLIELKAAAKDLGVRNIYVKDESKRFGLNSFKGLGAIYAMSQIIDKHQGDKKPVFVTATDGNHGKAVAWAASLYKSQAVVFMPKGSQICRVEAIQAIGNVKVIVSNSGYDDTVRLASDYARDNRCYLLQDTALTNYTKIPNDIALGYSTMVAEALTQMQNTDPTHVFLQAGVGSMAGGVLAYLKYYYGHRLPRVSIMEAMTAACIFESIKKDELTAIKNDESTIMAGLDCKEGNFLMFPLLKDNASAFFSCPDWVTKLGMQKLAAPNPGDQSIESGESGAIGFGLLNCLMQLELYKTYRQQLQLNEKSTILLFNTEGYTDEENCHKILREQI